MNLVTGNQQGKKKSMKPKSKIMLVENTSKIEKCLHKLKGK